MARAVAEAEQQRLRECFRQAPASIAVYTGPQHVYTTVNPIYERLAGFDSAALLGRPIEEVFPEVAGQGIFEPLDRVYRTGQPYAATDVRVQYNRGGAGVLQEAYFTFAYEPLRDTTGAVTGVLQHAVDVTEQVQARRRTEELAQQLRDERDRLRQIMDVLPEGVAIVNAQGQVEALNQAGQEIVGLDTRGRRLSQTGDVAYVEYGLRYPDGTPYPLEQLPLIRSLRHGAVVHGDQELLRHAVTDRDVPLLVNSAPLHDAAGAIVGAVAVFQDITAIKDLERVREEFLSSAARDLETSLTGIRGHAQLARRRLARLDAPEVARVVEHLAQIDLGVSRMLDLTTSWWT